MQPRAAIPTGQIARERPHIRQQRPPAARAHRGRVISLPVGRPGVLDWRGRRVLSAIAKSAVAGPLALGVEGLAGDEQAERRARAGVDKGGVSPVEHLHRWPAEIRETLYPGAFGENLSVAGLLEEEVCLGDTFGVGDAIVQVSQPRGPCFKLAARWGRTDLPDRMAKAGISGYYLRALQPGHLQAADTSLLHRVSNVTDQRGDAGDYRDRSGLAAVAAVPGLAERWRAGIERLLETPE
jgi:MOSC domain-containing protein YiiM